MRLAHLLCLLTLAATFAAGCGSSSDDESGTTTGKATPSNAAPPGASAESCGNTTVKGTSQLQVTGIGCPVGRGIVASWSNNDSCAANVSRPACTVYRGYRCIGTRVDAGLAVSCARPGRSLSFTAQRR